MKLKLTILLLVVIATICNNSIYGQFNTSPYVTDRWAQTNDPGGTFNDIRRGGMGNFTTFGTAPGAAFHINENYLTDLTPTAINYYLPGEVFRTTGPATNINAWRMFTGAGNGTERFSITTPANTDEAILQTVQNGAMRFNSNSTQRIHVNPTFGLVTQPLINGFAFFEDLNTSGYVGIGPNTIDATNPNGLWTDKGPFSLVHLNGLIGGGQEHGYRVWMKTGITFTDNFDRAYVGNRVIQNIGDVNEFCVAWGNDIVDGPAGPDDMVFRFTQGDDNNPGNEKMLTVDDDFTGSIDEDGRHIARFTPAGFFGLGPNFGYTLDHPNYVRPQSMFHMSSFADQEAWFQITNQTGTGQTATDGLRIGITNTGTAHIRQQEILPLIFYTGSNTGAVEDARIIPQTASTLPTTNHGMIGLGDWTTAYNTLPANVIDAKLDIDGDLRIRTVTQRDTLLQVLVIDSTDHNRVHWRSMASLGVGVGNYCADTQNPLTGNYEIPLNNFNYYFSDPIGALNQGENFVKIGDDCSTPIVAKLEVHRGVTTNTQLNNIGAYVLNEDNAVNINNIGFGHGVFGNSTGPNENNSGISGTSSNASTNYGGFFDVSAPYASLTQNYTNIAIEGRARNGFNNVGGRFTAVSPSTSLFSIGVLSTARGSDVRNFAGYFQSSHPSTSAVNYGVYALANNGNINRAIHASSPTTNPLNRAGYFVGLAESTVTGILVSDKMFKINVANIEKASDVLRKLKPHTYKMDVAHFPQFNFQDRLQYGFIAQEVADILPNLVYDSFMPSELDSLGNEISPAVNYKSLNYNALIPITVQAVNELNTKIDNATLSDQTVKTNVQNLSNSLDKVKQMRGVSYTFITAAQNEMNLDSLQHIGFIAQEIAAIEPLLTFTDDSSLVHVNYDRVTPLLVESVKELDNKILAKDSIINHLQNEINTIKECLLNSNICTEGHRTMNTEPSNTTNNRSVELVNTNSIILDQNLPNPFAENTVINYNIPAEVSEAKLLFYDLNGRIIKEFIIEERGESKLTVYGTNLKTGVYTYSLIADGELIATKKMVKK